MLEMMTIQAGDGDGVPRDGKAGVEFGGGYFCRRMKDENGDWYALVISPSAEGSVIGASWSGATQYAAEFTIGGYSDWKLMSRDEACIVYREFKPTTSSNSTGYGSTDKVEPPLGNYTSGDPSQTSLADWQSGGPEAFFMSVYYWLEDEASPFQANAIAFSNGTVYSNPKGNQRYVRAVRRHYF